MDVRQAPAAVPPVPLVLDLAAVDGEDVFGHGGGMEDDEDDYESAPASAAPVAPVNQGHADLAEAAAAAPTRPAFKDGKLYNRTPQLQRLSSTDGRADSNGDEM